MSWHAFNVIWLVLFFYAYFFILRFTKREIKNQILQISHKKIKVKSQIIKLQPRRNVDSNANR